MLCLGCGKEMGDDVTYCEECAVVRDAESAAARSEMNTGLERFAYAGFWLRFCAALIDGAILVWPSHVLSELLTSGIPVFAQYAIPRTENVGLGILVGIGIVLVTIALGTILSGILYFAAFQSSSMQASPGKWICKLVVTNKEEQRLSFGHALLREFAKILSWPFAIGYLMAAFTRRKQALHDLVAGTVVWRHRDIEWARIIVAVAIAVFIPIRFGKTLSASKSTQSGRTVLSSPMTADFQNSKMPPIKLTPKPTPPVEVAPSPTPTPVPLANQVEIDHNLRFNIQSAVGLHYPKNQSVAIALFSEILTPGEQQSIQRRQNVTSAFNGKRPMAVLFLDLPNPPENLSPSTLRGYTIYFYRDQGGAFDFPGNFDSVSFKRPEAELKGGKVEVLAGSVGAQGSLSFKLSGQVKTVRGTILSFGIDQKVTAPSVQ